MCRYDWLGSDAPLPNVPHGVGICEPAPRRVKGAGARGLRRRGRNATMATRTRNTMLLAAALCASLAAAPLPAAAQWKPGATAVVGLTSKNGIDLVLPGVALRLEREGPGALERAAAALALGTGLAVELQAAAIAGDRSSFEAQVVPMLVVHPRSRRRVEPYLEAGVGLAYTAVHGLRLGSELLFSDQAGAGLRTTIGSHRVGFGYRLRHLSHAGLWARTNSGMNTHFLVLTIR